LEALDYPIVNKIISKEKYTIEEGQKDGFEGSARGRKVPLCIPHGHFAVNQNYS